MGSSILYPFARRSANKEQKKTSFPERFPSDNFPVNSAAGDLYCAALVLGYSAIFFGGWSFQYPTIIERLLWRSASIAMLAYIPCGYLALYLDDNHVHYRNMSPYKHWIRETLERFYRIIRLSRTTSPIKSQDVEVCSENANRPLEFVLSRLGYAYCTGLCAMYCLARAYVLIEDVIGLRSLPKSAFDTVEWTLYLPQI